MKKLNNFDSIYNKIIYEWSEGNTLGDILNNIKNYQITKDNLPYATFLMHPGPINKGIEIAPDVLEMQNAKTILHQARNGVYVRMAILDMLLASQGY
jgi:aspartate carbamoyltransferase catalytic subunit